MSQLMGRLLPKEFCRRVMLKFDGAVSCTTSPTGTIVGHGGTVIFDGDYTVHTFAADGTFEIISGSGDVDTLVVGAGGAGGGCSGTGVTGGGGGGGAVVSSTDPMTVGTFSVSVGAGGSGTHGLGNAGEQSSFNGHVAIGGGGGGGNDPTVGLVGGTGSSGGGAGSQTVQPGNHGGFGVFGQGSNGGDVPAGTAVGPAGGGGSSSVGEDGSLFKGGDGGDGVASSITGSPQHYGAGGGGAIPVNGFGPMPDTTPGAGGTGGGAAGTSSAGVGNSGSGFGSGGGGTIGNFTGGTGAGGAVIIRYLGRGTGDSETPDEPDTYHGPILPVACGRNTVVDGVNITLDCNAQTETAIFPDFRPYTCVSGDGFKSSRPSDGILVFRFDQPIRSFRITRRAQVDAHLVNLVACDNYTVIRDPAHPGGSEDGALVNVWNLTPRVDWLHGVYAPPQNNAIDEVMQLDYSPGFTCVAIFQSTATPSEFQDAKFLLASE